VSKNNRAFAVQNWLCGACKAAEYMLKYNAAAATAVRRNIPTRHPMPFGGPGISPWNFHQDDPQTSIVPYDPNSALTWRGRCQLPCPNTTRDTWIRRTDAERKEIIRICLVCEGEVPEDKIHQFGWNNKSNTQIWPRPGQMGYPPAGG
jgi:hypothetical protein